jgi:hypothetical protein
MSESKMSPRKVLVAQRRRKAIQMRTTGATYEMIGKALGISEVAAWRHVQKGLARLHEKMTAEAETLRTETVRQLEAILAVHLPRALDGDVKSGNLAIRALAERAKITGLVKAQPVVPQAGPYDNLSRDELIYQAKMLGLWIDPDELPGNGHASRPVAPAPSTNGYHEPASVNWSGRFDGSRPSR